MTRAALPLTAMVTFVESALLDDELCGDADGTATFVVDTSAGCADGTTTIAAGTSAVDSDAALRCSDIVEAMADAASCGVFTLFEASDVGDELFLLGVDSSAMGRGL